MEAEDAALFWSDQFEQDRLQQVAANQLVVALDSPDHPLAGAASSLTDETVALARSRAEERDGFNANFNIESVPLFHELRSWKGISVALMLLDFDLDADEPALVLGYRPYSPGFTVPKAEHVNARVRAANRILCSDRLNGTLDH